MSPVRVREMLSKLLLFFFYRITSMVQISLRWLSLLATLEDAWSGKRHCPDESEMNALNS